jgi:histone acetyltransferase (RNA polymerase elongator complex component)
VDDRLILQLCKNDPAISNFSKHEQQGLLVDLADKEPLTHTYLKDPGQRRECGCIVSKDIGAYGTCPHMCVYCYANPTETIVASNMARLKVDSESLAAMPSGSYL